MNNTKDLVLREYQQSLPHEQISLDLEGLIVKILLWFLGLAKLLLTQGGIERFEKSIKFYFGLIDLDNDRLNFAQKPKAFFYCGLTSKPWHESNDSEALKFVSDTLEKGAKEIQDEWLLNRSNKQNIISRYETSDLYPSLKKDDWGKFILYQEGEFTKESYLLFPKTVEILSELKSYIIPFGEAVFLVLKPNVALPPHYDDSNIDITCQLGLIIPEKCALKVSTETRNWIEGKTLFFDHSFKHEAWNKSDQERVVLLLDLYHPELTEAEKFLLRVFGKILK